MQPNPQNPSFFDEGIKLISFCPLCQAKQESMEVKILDTSEAARLLHLRCQKCGAAILALVMISPAGLNSLGMITDLSADEVLKFKETDSIDADDVLAFHESLSTNKNWLKELDGEVILARA